TFVSSTCTPQPCITYFWMLTSSVCSGLTLVEDLTSVRWTPLPLRFRTSVRTSTPLCSKVASKITGTSRWAHCKFWAVGALQPRHEFRLADLAGGIHGNRSVNCRQKSGG